MVSRESEGCPSYVWRSHNLLREFQLQPAHLYCLQLSHRCCFGCCSAVKLLFFKAEACGLSRAFTWHGYGSSGRSLSEKHAPMPSLLVSGAVHQALVSEKLRTKAGCKQACEQFTVAPALSEPLTLCKVALVLESGEPFEVAHHAAQTQTATCARTCSYSCFSDSA